MLKKKILIVSCYLLFFIGGYAQYASSISVDRFEKDGRRQVMTVSKTIRMADDEYSKYMFFIKAYASQSDTTYFLGISSFAYIPSDAEVLMKNPKGEVLYLKANNVRIGQIEYPAVSYAVGNLILTDPSSKSNYYTSIYRLTDEDIQWLNSNKIIKIRISDGRNYVDRSLRSDLFGRWFRYDFNELKKTLRKDKRPIHNDIRDGF